jgi:outer membrane protein assembly factor BamA
MKVRGLLIVFFLPVLAFAQNQYWGATAAGVRLSGGPNETDLEKVPLRPGDKVTPEGVRASIQTLMDTGHYQKVQVEAALIANGVDLNFNVTPVRFFSTFRIEPGGLLPRALSSYLRLPIGERFSSARVERLRADTVKLLQNVGYFNAVVTTEYPQPDNPLLVTVVFKADVAAERAKFRKIEIHSTDKTFSERELRDALNISPGDNYSSEKLDQGIGDIRKLFANKGQNFG